MCYKFLLLHCCVYFIFASAAQNPIDESNPMKRDTTASKVREELHVRVLKYFAGRYKSIPFAEIADDGDEEVTDRAIEGSTTMEPYIKVTTTVSPDEMNMKVFGGYFTSVLGNSLAHYFNVTSKIHTTPPYAMIHYYFPADFEPPNGAFLGETSLIECGDVINFCPINSQQLCLKNGTVYCTTPMTSTLLRYVDGLLRPCIQTKVKVNCRKTGLTTCEKLIPLHIPCYAVVTMVEGDECAPKKVYKDKHCILITAYSLPKFSNSEFVDYLRHNEEGQRIVGYQINNIADAILKQIFQ